MSKRQQVFARTLLSVAAQPSTLGFCAVPEPQPHSSICFATSGLFGRERFLMEQEGAGGAAGGGDTGAGPGNGAAGGEKPKTYTQEDFDRVIGNERKATERKVLEKFKDYDQLKEQASKLPKLEQTLQELQQQLEDSTKDADQRAKAQRERAERAAQQKLEELTTGKANVEKERDTWKGRYIDREVKSALGSALDELSVVREMRGDALSLLHMQAKVESDDEGNILSIELNGKSYANAKEAAEDFLKGRPHMVSVKPPVGGGSRTPNSGGNTDLNGSAESLIAAGIGARRR